MPINAIALLRVAQYEPAPENPVRVQRLEDAVLVHMGAPFGTEPDLLFGLLQSLVGDVLEQHDDERGVFFIPDVAAPKARSYAAVIAEVGEGGMWGQGMEGAPDLSAGNLEAALGSMLGQMPPGLLDSLTRGGAGPDLAALQQASMGLQTLLQGNPQLAGLAAQLENAPPPALADMLSGGGLDIDSPAFANMMSQVQEQLAKDPKLLMSLAEQLFGGAPAPQDASDEEPQGDAPARK